MPRNTISSLQFRPPPPKPHRQRTGGLGGGGVFSRFAASDSVPIRVLDMREIYGAARVRLGNSIMSGLDGVRGWLWEEEVGGREQIVEEFPLYSGASTAVPPTPRCLKARKEIRPTATADFPSTNRRLMKSSPAVKCFMDKVNRMRAGEAQNFYVCV